MHATDPNRIGLCAGCRHARTIRTPRSSFWLCERSRTDTSYERYPRLPVLACPGFEPGEPEHGTRASSSPDDAEPHAPK